MSIKGPFLSFHEDRSLKIQLWKIQARGLHSIYTKTEPKKIPVKNEAKSYNCSQLPKRKNDVWEQNLASHNLFFTKNLCFSQDNLNRICRDDSRFVQIYYNQPLKISKLLLLARYRAVGKLHFQSLTISA